MSAYPSFPALRLLTPLAALALMATACGSSDDPPDGGENTSAENGDSAAEEEAEEDEPPEQPSLSDPGILMADCANAGEGGITFTLHSAEDASELHTAEFSTGGIDHAESEDLSHGRAAHPDSVSLEEEPCDDEQPSYLPERDLVVGTFTEEVNGNNVFGFGVLAEDGTFTALSPEQEVSDFETPINYRNPVSDPEGDRILFTEDDGGDTQTAQSLDMESGEVTELGTCDDHRCRQLTVLPGLDSAVLDGGSFHDLAPVLDGSALVGGRNTDSVYYFDLDDQADADLVDLDEVTNSGDVFSDDEPQVKMEEGGRFHIVDDNTLIFDDEVLSVWEFTADTFEDYEAEHADTPQYDRDPLPAAQTLVPEGPRTNSDPYPSPDGSEVLFRSSPPTGDTSWYRVPTDGSGEPEEFPALPLQTIIAWQ